MAMRDVSSRVGNGQGVALLLSSLASSVVVWDGAAVQAARVLVFVGV